MNSITVKELNERRERGDSVDLLDVRTPVEFREVHATVARNAPLDSLDPQAVMAGRNGSAGEPLYVICRSGGRSVKAVQKFESAGFDNVVNVEGGTQAWVAAGLPVVRGKKAMSLERQVRIAAGSLVLLGLGLSYLSTWFLGLSAFVGCGLVFAGVTDWCGMGMLLAKMPWNQVAADAPAGESGAACKV